MIKTTINDQRNCGKAREMSDKEKENMSTMQFVEDVLALIDHHHLKQVKIEIGSLKIERS